MLEDSGSSSKEELLALHRKQKKELQGLFCSVVFYCLFIYHTGFYFEVAILTNPYK